MAFADVNSDVPAPAVPEADRQQSPPAPGRKPRRRGGRKRGRQDSAASTAAIAAPVPTGSHSAPTPGSQDGAGNGRRRRRKTPRGERRSDEAGRAQETARAPQHGSQTRVPHKPAGPGGGPPPPAPIALPPTVPVIRPPAPEEMEDFGAGLFFEEPSPAAPTPSGEPQDIETADMEGAALTAPALADQEVAAAHDRRRPRRRSFRKGRGAADEASRPAPQTASEAPQPQRESRRGGRPRRDVEEDWAEDEPGTVAFAPPAESEVPDWMDETLGDAEIETLEPAAPPAAAEGAVEEPEAETAAPRRRSRRRRRRRDGERREDGAAAPSGAPLAEVEEELEEEPLEAQAAPEEEIPLATLRATGPGDREMLINVAESEECRIAVLHQGRLEEIFIERQSSLSYVGNVYKGRVTNVEPSIQAAFVDFGLPKNGFLHISDVHKKYFPGSDKSNEDVGRKIAKRDRPLIQKCLRRGQEIVVQVIKEGIGTKGPTVSTYLSIPGRFLVMMPGMSKLGVSRKIEDDDARRQMRKVLEELVLPEGIGFILRTAGLGQTKRELQRDLNYLTRLWKTICEREARNAAPAELYRESDLVIRTMRDVYSSDFKRVVVDDAETGKRIRDFLRIAMPRAQHRVELYADREPMFHKFGIEREIALLNSRRIPLRSGGSIVIDTGEAMTTIDVNSGKFRRPDNAEETALAINLEAADEITRQLRLRDIGGLIVCDFIDMVQLSNRRKVVHAVREGLRKHKERARVLNMSPFGLVEITRQRQRHSIARSIYTQCPLCDSTGWVKTPESVALEVIRLIRYLAHQSQVQRIRCHVPPTVAFAVLNRKRAELSRLEGETGKIVEIHGDERLQGEQMRIDCEDARGVALNVPVLPETQTGRPDRSLGRA